MKTPTLKNFKIEQLIPSILAGLVIGILIINIEISFASLIFSGPLSDHLAQGIGFTLFGAMVIGAVVALTSSYPGTIGMPISNPVPILALIAAAISQRMATSAPADAVFATAATALAMTSILTGAILLGLGRFKLGALIRFVPYPVIGGFLAGTGWLLAQGAIGTMAGIPFTPAQLARFIEPAIMIRWIPGVVFGVLLLFVLRRYKHYLILPGMVVGGILLFDGFLWATNTSLADARARGWLLGAFPSGSLWQVITWSTLAQADWSLVLSQFDKVGTVFIISVIALLLNSTGIELSVRRDIDLNQELASAGAANILAGLGGGTVGYQSQVITVLGFRMGTSSRLIGLVYAVVCGLVLFFGTALLVYLPKPIPTGLLLYLGLGMLVDWIYDGWFKLARTDYVLVLVILGTIVGIGFLEGVLTGVIIAVGLFVYNYSRINPIRHTLSGANFHSTVDRPISQRQFLQQTGEQLLVLQLHGFIFFGTAQRLLDQIRQRVGNSNLPRLNYLVIDFARVDGLDSSAVSSFVKLGQLAETRNIAIVLTHLTSEVQCQLTAGGFGKKPSVWLQLFPTLDQGVEWCENQILATQPVTVGQSPDSLSAQLHQIFPKPEDVTRFTSYLERLGAGANQMLIRQGDTADAMYFIEDGLATAQFELPDGRTIRLRTMPCGTIIGEVGLYTNSIRTASVWTTAPSTLYRLSASAIAKMEEQDPDIANALHKRIVRLIAERLAENNNTLAALMD